MQIFTHRTSKCGKTIGNTLAYVLRLSHFFFRLTKYILTSPVSKGVFEKRTATGSGLFAFLASNFIQISGKSSR